MGRFWILTLISCNGIVADVNAAAATPASAIRTAHAARGFTFLIVEVPSPIEGAPRRMSRSGPRSILHSKTDRVKHEA